MNALKAELKEVDALISAHPLASQRTRAAHAIVDKRQSRDATEVDKELAADGLPSVKQLGKVQASGTWSWWKLHRRKMKLEKKIDSALPR
ncbi:hypothetical protein O2V63_20190 [Modestobacter sp. VKM Ac-2977]|uniref:hypothetical protein n=1 Tax=Modestobacter sp. VKM Ac-2977 TaxID=3004131 RepID=UPI0022A9FEED|nr:hypothetical protein [Modestobacter sp. VKM Ac-2977]MCZ2822664.1 hypothetical protein [Modestobacter sp. VKM Ac-2977]